MSAGQRSLFDADCGSSGDEPRAGSDRKEVEDSREESVRGPRRRPELQLSASECPGGQIECQGLLFIGDPHLEARVPGFRSDDYPAVALQKFAWCLQFAAERQLQPFLLGDLFHLPQDNPNRLIAELLGILSSNPLPAIYGNHDVRENTLKENDSLAILTAAKALKLLSHEAVWRGRVRGRDVAVGGTSWGRPLPKSLRWIDKAPQDTLWMTHHDLLIPGYEESGRIPPAEISGIDCIINGHIHRHLETVVRDGTSWLTPGNIVRRSRSDGARQHTPAVLVLRPATKQDSAVGVDLVRSESELGEGDLADSASAVHSGGARLSREFLVFSGAQWIAERYSVPHRPFDEVFFDADRVLESEEEESQFIAGLRELTARRTETGAGLTEFLRAALGQMEPRVANEIRKLAEEVTGVAIEEINN